MTNILKRVKLFGHIIMTSRVMSFRVIAEAQLSHRVVVVVFVVETQSTWGKIKTNNLRFCNSLSLAIRQTLSIANYTR
jgi:hypothetical protein